MPIAEERESPRSLESKEIEDGIRHFVNGLVDECLRKMRGAIYGQAYNKFSAKGMLSFDLSLDNFGQETSVHVETSIDEGVEGEGDIHMEGEVEIPVMPPNQFRQETDQPVVVTRVEDGKRVEKRIKYNRRPAKKAAAQAAARKGK